MLYAIGKIIGLPAMGWVLGLSFLELVNTKGPIYTALHNRNAGLVFLGIFLLSLTGVYAQLVDLWRFVV